MTPIVYCEQVFTTKSTHGKIYSCLPNDNNLYWKQIEHVMDSFLLLLYSKGKAGWQFDGTGDELSIEGKLVLNKY